MKQLTMALWALMACFLLSACNDKKSKDDDEEKAGKGDYIQQMKDINKQMAKEGDDWSVDEWKEKITEYIDLIDEFVDSNPDDEDIEEFSQLTDKIKEHFDNENAYDAIRELKDDKEFDKKADKSYSKFQKMYRKLQKRKAKEEKDDDDEEVEEAVDSVGGDYTYDYYADSVAVANEYRGYEQRAAEPVSQPDSRYDVACQRLLTEYDLQGMSKYELKVMRNWIFARHGYIFKTEDMRAFFGAQSWYTPLYNDVTPYLNQIELKNIDFIKRHE